MPMLETIRDFMHMGGYAFYVWSAYGLTAAILALNALLPSLRERRLLRTLARRRPGNLP
jgi:heme exporter protein D